MSKKKRSDNMTAEEMFENIGYKCYLKTKDEIIYRHKTDYVDNSVIFHLGSYLPRTYSVNFFDWIDNKNSDWIPMEERESEWMKHCAKYGNWQKVDYCIPLELHRAIDKQIEELMW